MQVKKIWQKLFSEKSQSEEIELHTSGARIRHNNPFEDLVVPRNDDELDVTFANTWIKPYYMTLLNSITPGEIEAFAKSANNFTLENTKKLLGISTSVPKLQRDIFAAVNNHRQLEDAIGNLLLKSEVCYAALGYCLALAVFGGEKSKGYLKQYLEYYLSRRDLWFEQSEAFCALEYIDKNEANLFLPQWEEFISNKPYWDLEESRSRFSASIESILKIRTLSQQLP